MPIKIQRLLMLRVDFTWSVFNYTATTAAMIIPLYTELYIIT